MNTVTKPLLVLASLLTAGQTLADWNGGIEAGAQLGSDDRPALRFYAANNTEPLSHYLYLDWVRDSGRSNYRIGYNPTFKISESVYSFGRFRIEDDDPSQIDREIDASVGVGNNLFKRGNTQIKVEAGLGARQLTFDDTTETTRDGFGFLSGTLSTSLLALLRFDASITTKAGSDQNTLDGEAGISIPIGPGTALRYAYNVQRYNLDDGQDFVNEDSSFKITYGF